ncbi:MAG: hypothetical protein MUF54_16305 [Polyangiaceae bacterium]|jgi:hypothetical protein|nr:hypothetical protein [Polyangiaceae bacterium]
MRGIAPIALWFAVIAGVRSSVAQAPSGDQVRRDAARALARRGDDAFTVGRCDKAIPLWQAANERYEAPTILLRIARCQALLGKVVAATKTMEATVARAAQPGEPEAFAQSRAQASRELPNLRARIARLVVHVDTAGLAVQPRVLVDMQAVANPSAPIELDPGSHHVRVEARGAMWETPVELEDGSRLTVRVGLAEVPASSPPRTQRTVGYVIGGFGMASLAAGGYFAARASTLARELNGTCGRGRQQCPPDRQDDIDSLKTNAVLADLTLGGGAALFLAGAIVALTEPPPRAEAPRVEFFTVGLGVGVRGAF